LLDMSRETYLKSEELVGFFFVTEMHLVLLHPESALQHREFDYGVG
jgi:hypothetical protein